MPGSDSTVISTVFQYISKSILPIMIPLLVGAMLLVWTARSDVSHAQKDIDRIDKEHNSRIMANQISIRDVDNKVARIEASVCQILQGIDTTRKDMGVMKRNMSKLNGSILVLIDRDERGHSKLGQAD